MKKEKREILKKKYAGSFKGTKHEGEVKLIMSGKDPKKKKLDQPNLFGEQDQVYNTIQEEISYLATAIKACQDAIEKKEDLLTDLIGRKGKLDRAAEIVAKKRDTRLEKKKSKEAQKEALKKKEEK